MNRKIVLTAALALASAVFPLCAAESGKPLVANEKGASLDLTDIDAHLATIPEEARAGVMNDPERIDQILNQLLILRQASNEAKALGLDQDPIIAREMAIAGERVLFRYRMDKLKSDIQFPDFEQRAKEEYLAHKADYRSPELVDVSHILFMQDHDESDDDVKAQAEAIRKKVLKHPEDFAEFAKKYSKDSASAVIGGRLNMTPVANFVEDFAKATQSLSKEGEISPVVKSSWGYHIIQFHGRKEPETKSFEEVKPAIVERLKSEMIRQVQSDYVQNMRSLKIEANEEGIASLRTRYGTVPEVPTLPRATPAPAPAPANQ
ncbi:hypothetical protein C7S18_22125 [Ahniella affigens]|uniref:peptidylprolyl isomerase n=1 Tax=Ahniella affigens TaxID=2021234 RepID=A0A2P1PXY7_9GAMM|nr:peptidylprolyl isomerase [Ahniella affigens]AVP99705.1 hypothetical protein C7S18_22125 [Ahniella affigens]